jgi:Skp family chaperone for outer membrane proteins
MKKTILFLSLATLISATSAFAATATKPVPCAEMAKQVDAALKGNKLSPDKLTIVNQHDKAGQDLCKAQKDAAADTEFDAALKLLKKS